MRVESLEIYPVKSMAAMSLPAATVEPWGLAGDRRWMVVDPAGRFLTQRDLPHMALIRAEALGDRLKLMVGQDMVEAAPSGGPLTVRIWSDDVLAATSGSDVDRFLLAVLKTPCRLVYLDDPARRKLAENWRQGEESVAFTDGFPVLLASLASLDDLNTRLAQPIRINRFRANIVVSGAPPWAEDTWRIIRIGNVGFRVAKPCDRCIVTTIEQETAQRPEKSEPLRTLGTFRRDPRGVMFGQNLIALGTGEIRVGDTVRIDAVGHSNVTLI